MREPVPLNTPFFLNDAKWRSRIEWARPSQGEVVRGDMRAIAADPVRQSRLCAPLHLSGRVWRALAEKHSFCFSPPPEAVKMPEGLFISSSIRRSCFASLFHLDWKESDCYFSTFYWWSWVLFLSRDHTSFRNA